MKDEFYPEFKYPRCINARCDDYKVTVGPIFKLIEEQLFAKDWFIKKIPVSERPQYIIDKVNQHGAKIITTDYSQFEAHFTPEIMDAIEFELYRYMVQDLPDGEWWLDIIKQLMSTNVCVFRDVIVHLLGVRMSGEMNTSLGNGFSNLMLMLYTAKKYKWKSFRGVVEGDDGLFTFYGDYPTEQWFIDMGWTIKLKCEKSISTASFCGLIFDEESKQLISDPIKFLATYGWLKIKYRGAKKITKMRLLKAKMMSALSQNPDCPIIADVAFNILNKLKNLNPLTTYLNNYQVKEFNKIDISKFRKPVPTFATRLLMEEFYGITIADQLAMVDFLSTADLINPWSHPTMDKYFQNIHQYCYDVYVTECGLEFCPPLWVTQYKRLHGCNSPEISKEEESTATSRSGGSHRAPSPASTR